MDRTLLALLLLSALLISRAAPLATITIATILSVTTFFTWGSWSLLRGTESPQPEAQRVWDER